MKTQFCMAVLVVAGLTGGCEGEPKEVGAVQSEIPVPSTGPVDQPLGAACVPDDEWFPDFSGFGVREINLQLESPKCASRLCVVNHFQGRATCPYGQPASGERHQLSPSCLLPDGRARVAVEVEPQLVNRPPEDAVYCSCRCDGPEGTGPFCECPSGFECAPLIDFSFQDAGPNLQGSYCIKGGTAYDPGMDRETCNWETQNCGPG